MNERTRGLRLVAMIVPAIAAVVAVLLFVADGPPPAIDPTAHDVTPSEGTLAGRSSAGLAGDADPLQGGLLGTFRGRSRGAARYAETGGGPRAYSAHGDGTLSGRVVDADEQPMVDIVVRADDAYGVLGTSFTRSGYDGTFAFTDLASDRVRVSAGGGTAQEVAIGSTDVLLRAPAAIVQRAVQLRWTDGEALRLRAANILLAVVDATGAAQAERLLLEGEAMRVRYPRDARSVSITVLDVRLATLDVATGHRKPDVGPLPVLRRAVAVDLESSGPIEIPLARGLALAGTVRDDGGRAVAGATVTARRVDQRAHTEAALSHVCTDAEGAFRLQGLGAGEWTLALASGGFELHPDTKLVYAAGRDDVRLVVLGSRSVFGSVVDERGRPLEGATVRATPALTRGTVRTSRQAVTDAEGAFRIEGLAASEPIEVWVDGLRRGDEAWLPILARTVDDPEREQSLRMQPGALVRGRVSGAEAALLASARLEMWTAETAESKARVAAFGSPHADGTFALGPVPAGRYEIRVRHGDTNTLGRRIAVEAPAEDVELTLVDDGRLRGRVLGSGSGVRIDVFGEGTASHTVTDAGGVFAVGVPRGSVTLLVRDLARRRAALVELEGNAEGRDLEVTLGEAHDIEAKLAPPSDEESLTGFGAPTATRGRVVVEGRLDVATQSVRFDVLPPGTWDLRARAVVGRRTIVYALRGVAEGALDLVLEPLPE